MADTSFAKRLRIACDQHRDIPEYGLGRQTWIKERMGVSHEAVRKWFTEESRPRPKMMAKLAGVLGVDEAWLALGIRPDVQPKERRAWSAKAEGAVYMFMGMLQMSGAHCAFPRQDDPTGEFVSLYAISGGIQAAYHVTLGQMTEDGRVRFTLPLEYERCVVIGAVPTGPISMDFIHIKQEHIEFSANSRGGYLALDVSLPEGEDRLAPPKVREYTTGLLRFKSIDQLPVH